MKTILLTLSVVALFSACTARPAFPPKRFRTITNIVRSVYGKVIADNLSKSGWSWGCVSAIDSKGRTIWIADAHRDDGKRFIARAGEKLTSFLELESVIRDKESRLHRHY